MKLLKKIAASCLLSLGSICLLISIITFIEPEQSQESREDALITLVLGLPLTISGGWLLWSLSKQNQQQKDNQIRSHLLHLVEERNGSITVLDFAKEAKISSVEAKKYLDKYLKEFDAILEITEQGNIIYKFAFWQQGNTLQQLPEKNKQ
ncbi:MAG: hypothetical protein QNJ34_21240 [Xenococcaceae cyanobacterium MO_188.B29]|nr:hypothetical protein [Xenococcaceae cyanobacterium MO_188.B29]